MAASVARKPCKEIGIMHLALHRSAAPSWLFGLCVATAAVAACGSDEDEDGSGGAGGQSSAGQGGAQAGSGGKASAGSGGKAAAGSGGKAAAGSGGLAGGNAAAGGKAAAGSGGGAAGDGDGDAGVPSDDTDAGAGEAPKQFNITLTTSACFGACPVYDASIDQAGHVTFDGKQNTTQQGQASKDVAAQNARAVYDALADLGYWQLKDKYATEADGCSAVATDHPTLTWHVARDGSNKDITDYTGCAGISQLERLRKVDDLLVEKAELKAWIGP
jgi:hypothetical protein